MSFLFPKPSYSKPRNSSSSVFDLDDNHYKLLWHPEPDYDELLIRLSLFAFNRLSPSDQRKQVAKISRTVNIHVRFLEESDEASRLATFAELFKKLPFSDQLKVFLSEVIQKLKRESQGMTSRWDWKSYFGKVFSASWLQDQSTGDQDMHNEQLSDGDTAVVAEKREETSTKNEISSNWTSSFGEFFLGFSVIWFQGQSASGQDMLIEQLDKQLDKRAKGVVIDKRRKEESEKDFKLRRFIELCMNVVDFQVQEEFLKNAEWKLQIWGHSCDFRLIVEPQDFDSAAELLSRLWTFGVCLLSAKYQEQKIVEISTQVESGVETERPLAAAAEDLTSTPDHEEAMRIRRLTGLFNQVPVPTRIALFKELRTTLLVHKRYSEAVSVFRGLGSKSQTEIIEYMLYEITAGTELTVAIVVKFSGESEEDFRFRRFNKICIKHLSTWGDILWPEAYYSLQLHAASDPYDELLFGVAMIWFKANSANIRRNPVQIILFGKVEIGDTIEKLPEESEEDYKLRRFEESFKQLEFTSQKRVLDYIQDTISADLGYPEPETIPCSADTPSEGRGLFDPDWINYRPTNPRILVAATTQAGTATTQAGTATLGDK